MPQQVGDRERREPLQQFGQAGRRRFGHKTAFDQPFTHLIREPGRAFEPDPSIRRFGDLGLAQQFLDERDGAKTVAACDRRQEKRELVFLLDHQRVLAIADAADDVLDGMKPEPKAVVQQRDGDGNRLG